VLSYHPPDVMCLVIRDMPSAFGPKQGLGLRSLFCFEPLMVTFRYVPGNSLTILDGFVGRLHRSLSFADTTQHDTRRGGRDSTVTRHIEQLENPPRPAMKDGGSKEAALTGEPRKTVEARGWRRVFGTAFG